MEITDSIRSESKNAIQALVAQGLAVYLLTGDGEEPAKVVAEACGILNYKANFSPLDKSKFIAERQAEGHKVLMVGDGINDGPALALAEVSIAMGGGSDLAHQAAEIILQKEDLNNIPLALNIARKTWHILQQNLFWAFIYNLLFIPLAAGLGEVFHGSTLNPMMASAAMSLSSISVVLNSLRLKK
ncbi:MAG: HAD family hydrolase [Sphingobacteriia bacterium]|nr:HAD family hydrolase [Sphingobacteriia bacterium]